MKRRYPGFYHPQGLALLMLKLLRQGAIENPWFFRTIMLIIAVTFVISMGWFGFTNRAEPYVAQIDRTPITRIQYERYKENAYRYYRDQLKEGFKEEMVKEIVINSLVEQRLWLKLSRELRLSISVEELRDTLTHNAAFHDDQGRFDPDRYQFFLSRSHLMASEFEQSIRDELAIEKAQRILQDGIALTDPEITEAKATITDPTLTAEERLKQETQAVQNALARKQQQVLTAVLNQVRSATQIEIKKQLL